jgi:acyl-CoA synthetase (AMP-forming)/AMP-acid ligase II
MTLVGQMTLGDLTVRNLELRPAAPAVIFEGRTITHAEFCGRVFRLANALIRLGVQRGDRVAILAQNCPEYMESYAAGELGGWTTVTINFRLTTAEVAYILRDSRPTCVIVEAQFVDRLAGAAAAGVQHVVTIGGPGPDLAYEELLGRCEPSRPRVAVEPNDMAHLIYTSGTTGKPKGVMLSHRGELQSALISALEARVRPTDRLALAMPLYHIGGKNQWLAHSVYGCPIILHRAFRPSAFFASLREHAATVTLLAPTMLNDLLEAERCDRETLPALQKLFYSAAPMPEALLRRSMAAFGPILAQIYGMTECGGPGCTLHPHQHVLDGPTAVVRRLRSAGQPMVGCDVRVVRPDASECAVGETGEIVIRSPALMSGYWNNHPATLEAMRGGYLHTGDVGERDDSGFIFVVDRLKDMIVSGGENIYSREVEEALLSHAGVLEAAVIGAPDERWGEAVIAFVVRRPGHDLGADTLIAHCKERIAPYKRPRDVRFIDTLPKLPNGKIEKFKLRAPLWDGRERAV